MTVPVEGGEDERVVHLHILVTGGVGREIEREIIHLILAGEDRRIGPELDHVVGFGGLHALDVGFVALPGLREALIDEMRLAVDLLVGRPLREEVESARREQFHVRRRLHVVVADARRLHVFDRRFP